MYQCNGHLLYIGVCFGALSAHTFFRTDSEHWDWLGFFSFAREKVLIMKQTGRRRQPVIGSPNVW